ncbi:MAG: type II secretion protein F [Alphaproteobacteria bacterium CG11_big_fil_rev_8_21_14_0_20_44_7]|nr:MAG: type II secretion protein F [Alphaproteobacteria bacterium CG11_big_fil_rev_8_21_14_0_20_44_7]
MPIYNFKGIDEKGKNVRGKLTAANELDLESRLKDIRLDLISFREIKESKGFSPFGRVKIKDKIMLCIQLQQLDRAGVPILESLADLRDTTEAPKLKQVISDIYERVRSGAMLSEAMAHHPKVFDSVFVGLVAAGEGTGKLYESFENLAHHLKWNAEIRRKVKKAVAYPIFTLVVLVGVIAFMMGGVVPQLEGFLKAQGQEMPGHTKALIAMSDFFEEYWYIILPTPVVLFIIVKTLKAVFPGFAYAWDGMMLKLPILGPPAKKIDLARFTRFFGILYTSGIDILECLKVGQQVVKNKVILDSIVNVRKIVSEGTSLTGALRITNQFPNLVLRMFKIGENSGNMKEALENVNYFYDQEVNDAVDGIIGFIKPALTVFLGGMLAWIAMAMFGPLYDTINQMQL